MQGDFYSKLVNDKAWMTIAIVEQQHNTGLGLRIMPGEAEDNTSDTTFLQFNVVNVFAPESFLTEWPNAGSSSEHL